jgi:hypothetical protein
MRNSITMMMLYCGLALCLYFVASWVAYDPRQPKAAATEVIDSSSE